MEQHNSKTSENTETASAEDATQSHGNTVDAASTQQHSLPEGGDASSAEAVGGSKVDPVSAGPNEKETIAGRN